MKFPIQFNQRFAVSLFFLAFFLVGVFSFKDYGLSWDEDINRIRGNWYLDYVLHGDTQILNGEINKYYGPAFLMIPAAVERIFPSGDSRTEYFVRHFINFLAFYLGVLFFYLLCRRYYKNWQIGLLGSLFLVLSPRFFAHGFYNVIDIPLMSAVIAALYTLTRFLEKQNFSRLALHALACAVATDIRVTGVITAALTGIAFLLLLWQGRKEKREFQRSLQYLLLYGVLYFCFSVLFWPTLWKNPVVYFVRAALVSSKIPWGGRVLYLGKIFEDIALPWHYVPVWILISIPLLYLLTFIIGAFSIILETIRRSFRLSSAKIIGFLILLWFFLPLVSSILVHAHLYDEWRHLFFIYPALLMMSLKGLIRVHHLITTRAKGRPLLIARAAFYGLVGVCLLHVLYFMVKNHPYENVYFNRLAGKNMTEIQKKFEMDYWGLSYRQGLEYILRRDPAPVVKVRTAGSVGEFNASILRPEERERLAFVRRVQASVPLPESEPLFGFINKHGKKYAYRVEQKELSIRDKMTDEEKEELKTIYPGAEQEAAVDQLYLDSQSVEIPDYFITNFRIHPQEYPYKEFYSVKVGGAKIMGVYRW